MAFVLLSAGVEMFLRDNAGGLRCGRCLVLVQAQEELQEPSSPKKKDEETAAEP